MPTTTSSRPQSPGEETTHTTTIDRVVTPGDDQEDDLFALLSDEYTQTLLEELGTEQRPARDLVEACDMSRPTVYRRLNRLQDHDLVRTDTELHADGHHRNVFTSTVEDLAIDFDPDGVTVTVTLAVPTRDHSGQRVPVSAD